MMFENAIQINFWDFFNPWEGSSIYLVKLINFYYRGSSIITTMNAT